MVTLKDTGTAFFIRLPGYFADTDDDLICPGDIGLAEELGGNKKEREKNRETSVGSSRQTCCETMRPQRWQEGGREHSGRCGS